MSYFESCYDKAMSGNAEGLQSLKDGAEVGNDEAQYLLSCVYGNPDSPFWDDNLYKYWEEKIFFKTKAVSEIVKDNKDDCEEKADVQFADNYTPNREFGTKNYRPNWIKVKVEKVMTEENDVYSDIKENTKKTSWGEFLFSSEGRVSQSDYILFLIGYFVIWFIFIISVGDSNINNAPAKTLQWMGFLLFYPFMQIATKRCHDIGNSGIYLLIPFYFLYLLFVPGDKYKNDYGYPTY